LQSIRILFSKIGGLAQTKEIRFYERRDATLGIEIGWRRSSPGRPGFGTTFNRRGRCKATINEDVL
jgi:hypothetical protein